MLAWVQHLSEDPVSTLLTDGDPALAYFVRRDLLERTAEPVESLWELPLAQRLLRKQQPDGSWRYPGQTRSASPEINHDLVETFRSLNLLVDKFGFDRRHFAIERAAQYLFSCQTEEGDIRGILGTQYMPYYHALLLELLIRVGYHADPRVNRGLEWLLGMRQDDGGWIVPAQALPAKDKTGSLWSAPPLPPDRSRPFSHLATGMALRAFVVHPAFASRAEVNHAAQLLKARFLQRDRYYDRQARSYWTKFQFPFWWPNILTALDSLSRLGFQADDPDIAAALGWFADNQQQDGLWRTGYEQANATSQKPKERDAALWVGLAVCRVLKCFYG
jgi:hypothetical protein